MAPTTSPFDRLPWPVHTTRLLIRPATPDDEEANWRFRRLPEVAHWLSVDSTNRADHRDRFTSPERLAKLLIVELDGVIIGDLMLAVEDAWAQAEVAEQARGVQAELGWVFDPAYGGRGYATEAVAELLRLCFDGLGLRRVTAGLFADNTPSWRLAERLGMRRELHTVKESLHRSGEWLDGYGYALLAEEWRAARR
ncbi:GNAT family N-acetyltransferase [Nocardioides ferulae]|uniref:GNAT family N-acetyltransferase n=1 Tax=Nocardioides ferulae TaxID=2340821 RepID=UPI00197E6F3A|nr:GNAT family protein [Nocardioides ferulae]